MSTRSRIGIEMPDHTVVSVYCHWDGYPEWNGKMLVQHYQNREDVQELIDGGGIASLRTRNTWQNGSTLRDENGDFIRDAEGFMMSENDRDPQPLYYTERGEELNIQHTSFDEFVSGDLGGEEYAYLYDMNGNWQAFKTGLFGIVERVQIPNYLVA